ncbi:transposase [Geobacter sp. SVR]|nr:low calcium response locus protein S [Geobacter sp. SVR]GCF83896.1 transposase [Geobacter sp. SVR]
MKKSGAFWHSKAPGGCPIQKARFTEPGMQGKDVCRKQESATPLINNWKSKYSGMETSDLKRMKEMEAEMSRLKRIYADLALENRA